MMDAVPKAMDAISLAVEDVKRKLPSVTLRLGEPMKDHTSLKIGGPVFAMFFPGSAGDVVELCGVLREYGIEPLTIGNGTNMLVAEGPLNMVVIKTSGVNAIEFSGETVLIAGAGAPLSRLAAHAYERGLSGLEFAHGIPGSLGGAVSMNAGAYGGEMKDIVYATTAYGPGTGILAVMGEEHDFSFRRSRFTDTGEIVLSSEIRLRKAGMESIRAKMDELSARRRESQPLDLPSAGSVFKRPAEGYAAAFIEQAGLKGFTVGGAQVSEKHSGFIVNLGGATFSDVMAVIEHIQEKVMAEFGVILEPEVKIIRRR